MSDENDAIRPWQIVERRTVYEGRIFSVSDHRSRSPRTGELHDFQVIESPDWVNVIPVTAGGEVVLIRQYRHGVSDTILEIPGGMVDPGELPADAARRELREETGYDAGELRHIGTVHPNPAIQGNRLFSFLAEGAERRFEVSFDSTEEIEVVLEPLERIPSLCRDGAISHALVVAAFHWLHLHRNPG